MPDILLLGATGFTGRLVARYLAAHPQRGRFTWAVVARSRTKLEALAKELKLSREVALVILDVTNEEDVQRIIKTARVVINTVGPFHRYGTPVVRACVRNAVHYVDTTGETPWIRDIIMRCASHNLEAFLGLTRMCSKQARLLRHKDRRNHRSLMWNGLNTIRLICISFKQDPEIRAQ
jgi:short subunit dehydrogenase-like uncharacterized protein